MISKTDSGAKVQGTLVLTNKRLIFVPANQQEDFTMNAIVPRTEARLRFANIDDLNQIPSDPRTVSIPLSSIKSESSHEGIITLPSLKVKWNENGVERKAEFVEEIAGGRKKDLKDWARTIENLKSGKSIIQPMKVPPSEDTLEGKIFEMLGDMQEKGTLQIEEEVEQHYQVNLDPDEVSEACEKLVSQGFLDAIRDPSGDSFYRKRSPLGEDDLSS